VKARRRLDIEFLLGAVGLAALFLTSFLVPLLSPFDPLRGESSALLAPSGEHPFGTDNLGRDIFVRSFAALQLDFVLAIIAVTASLVIGSTIGALMGMWRNSWISRILTLFVDSVNAFPFIVLALGIVAVVGPSAPGVVAAIVLTGWARYARIARARALVVAGSDFVSASRLLGFGRARIIRRHVFPNVYAESLAFALSELVVVIIMIASLSFLGAGVRPPTAELGAMISEGRLYLTTAWWMTVIPGAILAITALCIQFVAEGYERMRKDV